MTRRTLSFVAPVLLISMLQATGCVRQKPAPPPVPGGVYKSISAGANFDQSVGIEGEAGNISSFFLRNGFRPNHAQKTIYLAAAENGFVQSFNDGDSWEVIKTPLTNTRAVLALENGTMLAAGTNSDGQGFVIRSVDSAKSWDSVLTTPIPKKTTGLSLPGSKPRNTIAASVIAIAIDPFNSERIYAGTSLGDILVSEDSGRAWRAIKALSKNNRQSDEHDPKFAVIDLYPSPHTKGELWIITQEQSLWRIREEDSENQEVSQVEVVIPRDLSRQGERRLFNRGGRRDVKSVIFSTTNSDLLLVGVDDGAVLSENTGQTWRELPLPISATRDFNTVVAAISPTNDNRLIVGINNVIYRSEDGGKNWNTFRLPTPNHYINDILINPINAASVLVVTRPVTS